MNVYDTANKLAQELKNSEEYLNYKKAKENLELSKKEKVFEFEKLRYNIQIDKFQEREENQNNIEKMKKMYLDLIQDEEIKNYFDAELKFNVMLTDVNKIIAEAVEDVIK